MVFGLSKQERTSRRIKRKAENIIIRKEVAKETAKRKFSEFEERKARAVERARNPLSKRFRGIAIKAGRRTGKDIRKSIKGFAKKVGKPRTTEKETLVIIEGKQKKFKGKVRVQRQADIGFDLGLGLMDEPKRRKPKRLKPMRFF